ncbi:MAG: ABC transporter permease [Chryseolinea sp.]
MWFGHVRRNSFQSLNEIEKHIPKIARKLLLRFLRDDLVEEVLGDLEEDFSRNFITGSLFRAKVTYWYQVCQYMRAFAIRKKKSHHNHFDMFKNYFKISWRNLIRNRGYSSINIGGLALGMAISVLIGLWILDELTYNQYHKNYERIVQVMQHQTTDGVIGTSISMPIPLRAAMQEGYGSEFTHLSLASWVYEHVLSKGEQKITKTGGFVEPAFPEMMTLKMLAGSLTALKDQTSILIAESTAKALFGEGDPINQSLRMDNKLDVKVGGVYEDIPFNSQFNDMQFIAAWDLYLVSESWLKVAKQQWYNNSFQIFAQLAPRADASSVSEKIKNLKMKNSPEVRAYKPEVFVYPMRDWHLRSEWKNGANTGGRIQMVWMFGTIGLFVLLLACINFMNLSTARSEKRAKEVGIRMAIGSVRSQLINQFLSESFLVVLLSFLICIGLVILALPAFNQLSGKKIILPFGTVEFWMISFVFIVVTTLLAGSYPALYLSSFHPVKILKGTFKSGRYTSVPRKVLVILQFTVSVSLVIGTVIIYEQIRFSKARPVGYDRSGLVMVQMSTPDFFGKYDVLRTDLKNTGFVDEMAEVSSPLWYVGSYSAGFSWEAKDPTSQQSDFGTIWVTQEYGKTTKWNVLEGRDFSSDFLSDSSAMILNEASVKFMGLVEPIGKTVKWGYRPYHVIGVVEDMVVESPYKPVKPLTYLLDINEVQWIQMRLTPEKTTAEALVAIEGVFKKNVPSVPFEYSFVDDEYAQKFVAEERIGKLAYVFATLAIIISCLGLFGLASFVAEQRTKEIGIRKVLGATVFGLWRMLSRDFLLLIVISCLIAAPTSIYFLADWLEHYQYHIEVSWWIPVTAILGALFLTLFTVSFQVIRSAMMNPVNSLKSE